MVDQGAISPTFVPTGDMTADLLTKALPRLKVEQFCQEMGLAALRGSLLVGRVAQSGGSVELANCVLIVLSHIVAPCCYVSLLLHRPIELRVQCRSLQFLTLDSSCLIQLFNKNPAACVEYSLCHYIISSKVTILVEYSVCH